MREIATMLDFVRLSEKNCYKLNVDWETIDQMSLAWDTPVTFGYKSEKDTTVNGRNVYQ